MLPLEPQPRGNIAPIRYMKKLFYSVPPRQFGFSGIELFYWAAAAGSSMLSMYLQSRGMSAGEVGRVSSFLAFVGIFAPPFWGMVSDKVRSAKRVFMLLMAISAVIWLVLPLAVDYVSLSMIWILLPLFRFFCGPTNALLDSWIVRATHTDRRMSYGVIRTFGSFGFAVVAILYTFLIQNVSINVVFIGFAVAVAPLLLITAFMKDDSQSKRAMSMKELRGGVGQLMRNFPYVAFLLFNIALYMPVNASFTFLPFLLESIGEDTSLLGAIIGIKAFLEIPLLLLSGKLIKKFPLPRLLIAAACVYALEMFLYPLCGNVYTVLLVQCMHGAVFGLYLSAQIQYVYSLAPEGLTATAQTLSGASTALAGIIGNSFGGLMIDTVGIRMFYIVSGFVQTAAVIMFVLSLRHSAKLAKAKESAGAEQE